MVGKSQHCRQSHYISGLSANVFKHELVASVNAIEYAHPQNQTRFWTSRVLLKLLGAENGHYTLSVFSVNS
jgi:hypothetical protein